MPSWDQTAAERARWQRPAGRPEYEVMSGSITYNCKNLLEMKPEERAREGFFPRVPISRRNSRREQHLFFAAAFNELCKARGEAEVDPMDFLALVKEKMKILEMDYDLFKRPVNEGFSGGEKKRDEIFQMAVLEPKLAILDETDSGLDIDAFKTVAAGVNKLRRPDNAPSSSRIISACSITSFPTMCMSWWMDES